MEAKVKLNKSGRQNALVLFSGGQDSAVCLAWALDKYDSVYTIGFDYNQRHSIELKCRKSLLKALKDNFPDWSNKISEDFVINLNFLSEISSSALTESLKIQMSGGLPNTFLPGRNILFFSIAATLASKIAIKQIIGGMCETDYSGYPDCRNETLRTLEKTIQLGFEESIKIELPLMFLNKRETWELAQNLGGSPFVDLIIEETHTCYYGERGVKHSWGYGCGACPACQLRKNGYELFVSMSFK